MYVCSLFLKKKQISINKIDMYNMSIYVNFVYLFSNLFNYLLQKGDIRY